MRYFAADGAKEDAPITGVDSEIARLNREIAERDAVIAAKDGVISEQGRTIAEQDADLRLPRPVFLLWRSTQRQVIQGSWGTAC